MKNISVNIVCGATAAVLLLIFVTGCGLIGSTVPKTEAKEAAAMVLQALQKKDYAKAFELLNTGAAGRDIGSADALKELIESKKLQPQSWTFGEEKSVKVSPTGNNYYTVLEAQIIFADGTKGTAHFEMEVFGLIENPWRFRAFQIKH
jgi:hypothetical protein